MKEIVKPFPLLVTILALSSSLAWAQPVPPRPDMPPQEFSGKNPMEDIIEQLGLSQEQKDKLKEHKHKYDIINMEILSKIDVLKQKLQYELTKKEMDKAAIDVLVEETKQQQEIFLKNHVARIVTLREILTYEQFEKLEGFHQKAGGRKPKVPRGSEDTLSFPPGR